jgi:hypothetical protein
LKRLYPFKADERSEAMECASRVSVHLRPAAFYTPAFDDDRPENGIFPPDIEHVGGVIHELAIRRREPKAADLDWSL